MDITKTLIRILSPDCNRSPLKRMTAHNRNRNHNDADISDGADFAINIPAAYR